jgi:hypothetical protein
VAKGYTPNPKGVRQIAQLASVQSVCLRAAEDIARAANLDDPRGRYVAEPVNVESGWDKEQRAGARVRETARGLGGLHRTLIRLTGTR